MKPATLICAGLLLALASSLPAAEAIQSKSTYAKAYGETKNPVAVDPAKDLPRYPAVEPKEAIATWQVKKGFKLQLAAHEPQVRDPIAICFDENGRMFACEMIDYSEMRDATPHLGRISMLEDKDGDGYYETSQVFADDLPWPTGLIWAHGGLFVGATPDIWRFEDKDGDGRAEVREKVFTGFGTGLRILNVQGLMNSFQWGQDNRIHVLAGGGNRGVVTSPKRSDLKGVELGGKDFWFDPRTLEFGLEGGGAQYGMSFDNYGRKFGCSNSDHLQYWVYDNHYSNRNPHYQMPTARQSIAVDGGAAEVFRISPDEPWRIIRTRWRIAGVVRGVVEGGGRVSGYFTGATGTTIYRGDAYGPEFVNNSFSGDAGGQLVHRKIIKPSADGISLVGERPADERGFEFAASKDTWVRVVNFANAPDGCLHICDMYREVIEHPWSIPDEIKKHLDLNNGNNRGRIYRIVPEQGAPRIGQAVKLGKAGIEQVVATLGHPNGWHRDTAQRLIYERQDKAAVPLLEKVLGGDNALAKLHALGALEGLKSLRPAVATRAISDANSQVKEHAMDAAMRLQEQAGGEWSPALVEAIKRASSDGDPRVRFHAALILTAAKSGVRAPLIAAMAQSNAANPWMTAALLSSADDAMFAVLKARLSALDPTFASRLIATVAAGSTTPESRAALLAAVASDSPKAALIRALGEGLARGGSSIQKADAGNRLAPVFAKAVSTASDGTARESARLEAIDLVSLAPSKETRGVLLSCLAQDQPDAIQAAAIKALALRSSADVTAAVLQHWPHYGAKARAAALDALLAREDRAVAMLESKTVLPSDLSASQVQALIHHKSSHVAELARKVLASVIPPSREEVVARFKPALTTKGDATRGQNQFVSRCMACHRAGTMGLQIGPDLVTVKTKGRDGILTAILEPHKEVASQFIAYVVNTKDGQTLTGIIVDDNATSMTLKMMGGLTQTVPRSSIKGSSSSGQSLMPEGLETGMTVQDMADLLDFIESLK